MQTISIQRVFICSPWATEHPCTPIHKNAPNHEEWAGHLKDERAPRDYKESWAPKTWCFRTAVLEKTLESSLDCKESQPVHPEGDQSWIVTGRTDAEAETPILWPPDVKNWLIRKDPDAGKDWRWEEKGMTEDEMVEWHHQLNGHAFG